MLVTRPQPVPRPMGFVAPGSSAPLAAAPQLDTVNHEIRSEGAARLAPGPESVKPYPSRPRSP
jgi:hypothetical protein